MRHTWRNGYLKVAHCTFLMTSHFYSLIFCSFLFDLHRYFAVENRTSESVKTFFIFCSPPTLSVENKTSENIGASRGATVPCPSFWPCNKVLKPNFQSIISQTNNGCSLLLLILAKLLILDISCENIFALFLVTALTARPFSIKKSVLKWVFFLYENLKNPLAAGGFIPRLPVVALLCQILNAPLSEGVKWRPFFCSSSILHALVLKNWKEMDA